eukprot:scaffold6813_cov123-Isochrysis_galbana.AAC.1
MVAAGSTLRQSTARHIRDFPSFYRRHPQSKHQLQEYRSTVLQVLEAAGLRPLVEGMCTRDLLAYRSPDLDAIYPEPELVASADGSITAADVEKRRLPPPPRHPFWYLICVALMARGGVGVPHSEKKNNSARAWRGHDGAAPASAGAH